MNWRKHLIEAATLIVAAVVCAMVANAFASRERKLAVVPQPTVAPTTTTPIVPVPTTTIAAVPVTTTTIPTTTTATVNRQPATPKKPPPPEKTFNPHPNTAYIEIHGADVEALHQNAVLFLDRGRTYVH